LFSNHFSNSIPARHHREVTSVRLIERGSDRKEANDDSASLPFF
jgi:hypothetical protein